MANRFAAHVTLVTGGASGIGRATAIKFGEEGAKVVVADVDQTGGQATVAQITQAGGEACFVHTDVSMPDQVMAMVDAAVNTYGRVDCAFNNAGVLGPLELAIADYPDDAWAKVLGVNLTGVWLCMKYEIKQMLKQGRGAIVNTASVMGLVGTYTPAYSASKHGVVGITKSAAISYSAAGIRVNAVCPGFIETPMAELVWGTDMQRKANLTARHLIGRLGQAEEVAEAVLWLCSDAASFVTGHALPVDGGYVVP